MNSPLKTIAFVAGFLMLALSVYPAAAQVETVSRAACGFPYLDCSGDETLVDVNNFILTTISAFLILIGTLATIFLVYAGVIYISSSGNEEQASRAKRQVLYAVIGIILALSANLIMNAVVDRDALTIVALVDPFINMAVILTGTLATIYLIYAGFVYITSEGDEQESSRARRQILYAVIGIILALSANIILNAVINRDALTIVALVDPFINMALALISTIAAISLIYAGTVYITSTGDIEESNRARRQILYSILGLVVAGAAYTIVNVVVTTDPSPLLVIIRNVVNAVLAILAMIAAVYMIVAGTMYITSAGEQEQAARAKGQIIYALAGIAVIILSSVLVNFIIAAV